MTKQIQDDAKENIRLLLEKYDVRYIGYDAVDDEYTICLEIKKD
ncbi:hypothetical protein [Cytobacillus horneckiae]